MSELDDLAVAAFRIGQSSQETEQRTIACADALELSHQNLLSLVGNSRSGDEAAQAVLEAAHALRACAGRLLTLSNKVDDFVADLRS